MEFLIALLVFGCVALAAMALMPARTSSLRARLGAYQFAGPLTERDVSLEKPLFSRVAVPLLRRLAELGARLLPQRAYEEARVLMVRANWSMDLTLFMGLRAAGLFGAPLLYLLVMGFPN